MTDISRTHAEYLARRSFGSLDGLRALAVLAVIWHHAGEPLRVLPGSRYGFLGVDLFFVLSGFLIVTLLLRERAANGDISLRKFYARRTLRIFPLYYGVLAALSLALAIGPEGRMAPSFFRELPYYLTYTSNWIETATFVGIAWSLAAEEQFYLLWPPIEKALKRWALPILFAFLALNQVVNLGWLDAWLEELLGFHKRSIPMLRVTFTPICLGVLLAHGLHAERGFEIARRTLGSRWSAPLALGLLVGFVNLPGFWLFGWKRLVIHLLMTLLLCACVVREDNGLQPILSRDPLRRIGVVSYGMYLLHMIANHFALMILESGGPSWPYARLAITFVLTWIASELSFRALESPFLKLKRRFSTREGVA